MLYIYIYIYIYKYIIAINCPKIAMIGPHHRTTPYDPLGRCGGAEIFEGEQEESKEEEPPQAKGLEKPLLPSSPVSNKSSGTLPSGKSSTEQYAGPGAIRNVSGPMAWSYGVVLSWLFLGYVWRCFIQKLYKISGSPAKSYQNRIAPY